MAYDFPASPSVGQIYTPSGGPTFQWNGVGWIVPNTTNIVTSDSPPPNPAPGQLWWESDTGRLFIWYNDGNSQQWIQVNGLGANFLSDSPSDGTTYARRDGSWVNDVVVGPASVTDNMLARFDGASGKLLQGSPNAGLTDAGALTVVAMNTLAGNVDVASGYAFSIGGSQTWVKRAYLYVSGYSLSSAAVYATGATGVHDTFWMSVMDNFTETHMGMVVSPINTTTPGTARSTDLPASLTSFFAYGAGGTGTMYAYQEYFSASAPYDFGDGEIPPGGFVFAEIDKGTGWIRQIGYREDPPWYGDATPSKVYPDGYRPGTGIPFMRRKRINDKVILTEADLRNCGLSLREAITAYAKAEMEEIEITVAMKNTDWAFLPTPMAYDPAVREGTAEQFILDPFDPVTQELCALHKGGHVRMFHDLLHTNGNPSDILIDAGTPLARKGPPGAKIVRARWR